VVALSLVRELGPVLTALTVGGRVASGIAAELGSMVVGEQIDAMRAMGADPVHELVMPRALATAIALPLCTIAADLLGLAGAMGIARLDGGIPASYFLHACLRAVTLQDLLGGLIKTLVFGLCIALIACRAGLQARGGTRGVGAAATQAVVQASITVLVLDFLLTKALMGIGL
jgi:phospholipid/cholesterol/gamma-HCH transport system permease protein